MSAQNEALVTAFLGAWSRLDFPAAAELVTDDFVYLPDPAAKLVHGREAVLSLWRSYLKFMTSYEFKTLHMISSDTIVMMERTEWIGTRKGKTELPIMGIFEVRGGKLCAWRDYWDTRMAEPVAAEAAKP
jgi:limonene-1,2-epoxide hydrolase